MEIHQTSTPSNSPAKAKYIRGVRERHRAQMPNDRKASAITRRSQGHGAFE